MSFIKDTGNKSLKTVKYLHDRGPYQAKQMQCFLKYEKFLKFGNGNLWGVPDYLKFKTGED